MIRTNLSNPNLNIFHQYKENQLFRINEPNPGIFIAESPVVISRALNAGYEPISYLAEEEQLTPQINEMITKYPAELFVCDYEELKTLVGYHMSRGLLCALKRKPNPSLNEVCLNKQRIVVLENIMNPTNTGAIIRSAAALNIEAILLTKGCADPLQRRSSRVSMGNIFSMPWAYMDSYLTDTEILHELGYKIISMALTENAVNINELRVDKNQKTAIIMGTEGEGLNKETIAKSDYIVKIPMSNNVDSLNVAAASAIAFWELNRE